MNEDFNAESVTYSVVKATEEEIKSASEEMKATLEELKNRTKKFFEAIATDTDCLYVFSTRGIGDFIIAGGLSHAAQKRKGKKSTILVIQDQKWDTGLLFPNVSAVIHLPSDVCRAFNKYFLDTEVYEGDNYIYANIRKEKNKYIWSPDINMLERFKKDAFKIPLDTPLIYPTIKKISDENISELQEKYILDRQRTIILSPHAKTFGNTLNNEFWLEMAQRLKEKNYIVYTNVVGEEQAIEGTEPINVNFAELYYITDKVKCFVGLNSGVFVFLAMTGAILLNVTPFPHWYWDISHMFPESNNRTFYDTAEYTKNLENVLKKYDVSFKIKYEHKYLATENIFYSPEEILEAMLDTVEEIHIV